ncbi:MAG: hypothetical protein IJL32_12150 [Oscillospiraceae bacterium]|nr:hypothetical protein [Oscillospiraceae bacterium]
MEAYDKDFDFDAVANALGNDLVARGKDALFELSAAIAVSPRYMSEQLAIVQTKAKPLIKEINTDKLSSLAKENFQYDAELKEAYTYAMLLFCMEQISQGTSIDSLIPLLTPFPYIPTAAFELMYGVITGLDELESMVGACEDGG